MTLTGTGTPTPLVRSGGPGGTINILTDPSTAVSFQAGGGSSGGGNLYLAAANLNNGSSVAIGATSAGTYVFGSNVSTAASLTQSGNVTITGAASTTQIYQFDVAANNTLTISGNITGTAAGTQTFNKTSAGTLVLTGNNTYGSTVATTISAGTLLANNASSTSATGASTASISSGTTLGGTGFITGQVTTNAGGSVVAPGIPSGSTGQTAATGMLTLSGGINATNGLTLNDNINGATAVGSLTLGGTSTFGGTLTLNFTNLGGGTIRSETPYALISALMSGGTGSGTPTIVIGTLPTGDTLDTTYGSGGYTFNAATDSLTVEFATVAAVPEPGTGALAGGLLLLVLGGAAGKRLRRHA